MTVSITAGASTATALDLLSARLTRNLHTAVLDVDNRPQLVAGVPGLLAGTLVYLHSDWASAAAMETLYQVATVTLNTGGGALHGLKHRAQGTVRIESERAVPGYPARWLLTVDVLQLP